MEVQQTGAAWPLWGLLWLVLPRSATHVVGVRLQPQTRCQRRQSELLCSLPLPPMWSWGVEHKPSLKQLLFITGPYRLWDLLTPLAAGRDQPWEGEAANKTGHPIPMPRKVPPGFVGQT